MLKSGFFVKKTLNLETCRNFNWLLSGACNYEGNIVLDRNLINKLLVRKRLITKIFFIYVFAIGRK